MRGTLSSYASLFKHRVRTRKGVVSLTTWVLYLFLLCSILGRFGVAFLGFAFNLDDNPYYYHPIVRADWVNGTVGGNHSIENALAPEQDSTSK